MKASNSRSRWFVAVALVAMALGSGGAAQGDSRWAGARDTAAPVLTMAVAENQSDGSFT